MRNKSRKRIWSGAMVMSFTIVGVLVAFAVLAGNPALTDAHSGGAQGSHCTGESDAFAGTHDALTPADHPKCADDTGTGNARPVVNAPAMDTIVIVGIMDGDEHNTHTVEGVKAYFSDPEDDELTFIVSSSNTAVAAGMFDGDDLVITTAQATGEATITVTATDEDGSGMSAMLDIMVRVRLSPVERYNFLEPRKYEYDAPSGQREVTFTVEAVDDDNSPLSEDATVSFLMQQFPAGDTTPPLVTRVLGWDSSTDSNIEDDDILQGLLTVRAVDEGRRGFTVYFRCFVPAEKVEIKMFDETPVLVDKAEMSCKEPEDPEPGPDRTDASDAFTVTSYGDWDFDGFTDGIVDEDDPAGVAHIVNDHHRATGMLHRDEPVVTGYQLGISAREDLESLPDGSPRRAKTDANLTREENNADVEEGQRTVEVLVGAPNVQLTVTSMAAGPAYIRFLDKEMKPFGTDVDEEAMWRGADVVGLDSQGHLALNKAGVELSAAQALAYDQYNIVTPGVIPGLRPANSYLVGAAGAYNQGSFRIYNPCPTDDHYFYVQVHEAVGKYLRTTEKIDCIPPLRPGPTGLAFEIDSDKAGEAVLTFERGRAAGSHTALLIDARNRNIVSEVTRSVGSERVQRIMFDNLNNGWTYHIVVIAHGANEQHTADALKDFQVRWLNEADVPLSTDSSDTATRRHALCQTGQANVMALLSDCDAAPADLTAPTGVMATANSNDVTVRWTDGANAVQHVVLLLDSEFALAMPAATQQTDGTTTFQDVPAGSYTAVVVAIESTSTYRYSHATVSVGQ